MAMLDPRAREAARLWAIEAASDGGVPGDDYIDGILTAYLSTVTPAEVGGLVERLQSHMGKQDTPVLLADCRAAATALEAQTAALAVKDAEISRLTYERDVWRSKSDMHSRQATEARAALAEARKVEDALERDLMDARTRYMGAEELLDLALNTLDVYAEPAAYTDSLNEPYSSEDQHHPGAHAREVAANIRAARRALTGGEDG